MLLNFSVLVQVISENKLKPRLATKPRLAVLGQHQLREREKEKNQAANMKHLVERKSLQPNLRVKTDLTDTSGNGMAHTPSNQAYFCRKCYQVIIVMFGGGFQSLYGTFIFC